MPHVPSHRPYLPVCASSTIVLHYYDYHQLCISCGSPAWQWHVGSCEQRLGTQLALATELPACWDRGCAHSLSMPLAACLEVQRLCAQLALGNMGACLGTEAAHTACSINKDITTAADTMHVHVLLSAIHRWCPALASGRGLVGLKCRFHCLCKLDNKADVTTNPDNSMEFCEVYSAVACPDSFLRRPKPGCLSSLAGQSHALGSFWKALCLAAA